MTPTPNKRPLVTVNEFRSLIHFVATTSKECPALADMLAEQLVTYVGGPAMFEVLEREVLNG